MTTPETSARSDSLTVEYDPFDGYTVPDLRASANYIANLQRTKHGRWFRSRYGVDSLAMSWVGHTLDALDLLEHISDALVPVLDSLRCEHMPRLGVEVDPLCPRCDHLGQLRYYHDLLLALRQETDSGSPPP